MDRRRHFELLYGAHAPAVKAYVLRRADAACADDVTAEVFAVCWRRFEELPAEPLPWLLGVARRVLGNERRGERRRAALGERLAQTIVPAGYEEDDRGHGLAEALDRLGEEDRELLLLISWEGLTPAQAASALGCKHSTLRVRLMRARRRLAAAMVSEETVTAVSVEVL